MATALPSFLDSMKCPICLDFAENAVETVCCAQVYCEKCVTDLKGKNCSSCREPNLATCESRLARRTLGELPIECPNSCDEAVTRATLEEHKEICPNREHQCPVEDCDFSGLSQHLADHAAAKHPKEVVTSLSKAFQNAEIEAKPEKVFNCPFGVCQDRGEMEQQELINHIKNYHGDERDDLEISARAFRCAMGTCNMYILNAQGRMSRQALQDHIFQQHVQECAQKIFNPQEGPIKVPNSEGEKASMAQNGKFYCGREDGADTPADEEEKPVKQTPCTYESKLNCRSCMKLDVTMRNLPYGSLVNGAGHIARPSFCNHEVKGSEYFAGNSRNALCRFTTCGDTPNFTCNVPGTRKARDHTCSLVNPCKDCYQINYVYGVHFDRGNDVKEDKDYYGYVWKKT